MPCKIEINDLPEILEFDAGDISILHCALRYGIVLPHSCQDGRCGECKVKILNGSVNSKDDFGVLASHEVVQGFVLACGSVPSTDVVVEADFIPELSAIKVVNLPVKVNAYELVTGNVAKIVFRLPPNNTFNYLPGQYLDLTYKGVTRSYSIANAKRPEGSLELHIRQLEGGAMSQNLFPSVPANELMRIYGPRGTFFLRSSNRPAVFIATGTGYAPIKAMLEGAANKGDGLNITFYWGNSDPAAFYDLDWLLQFEERHKNFSFTPILRRPVVGWEGAVGAVFEPVMHWAEDLAGFDFYLCGSPAMIEAAKEALVKRGAIPSQMYSDAFFYSK